MEQPDEQGGAQRPDEDMGEDHREGPPGYDLDEQEAIEELERERESGGGSAA
jgi:hypothetical protein